jgi:predicted P-loop ATPase
MSKVSIYPHIKETKKSDTVFLSEVFDHIRSDFWAEPIIELRNMVALGFSEIEISQTKNSLPYFTGSGVFTNRNEAGLVEHSGRIIIDFDKLEDIPAAKALLQSDQYTEYLFLSCTGRGFAVVVKIDPKQHLDSFLFLEKYYKNAYGLQIDKACKDISRPRYISYDPDLFHNPDSLPVQLAAQANTHNPITAPVHGSGFSSSISIDSDEEKYEWCLNVHNQKESYVVGNRHNYLVVFAYFLNKCGVNYNYCLDRILTSFVSADKTADEIAKIVKYAYDKGVDDYGKFKINKAVQDMPPEYVKATKQVYAEAHAINREGREVNEMDISFAIKKHDLPADLIRSIFKKVFENNQDEHGIDKKPDIYKVENFIRKRWLILKNEVTHRTEGRLLKSTDAKLSIINVDEIARELAHANFKFPLDKLKSLLRSEFVPKFNPFKKYFEELPPNSDGMDHIDLLSSHIKTDNDEFWQIQFKKALVRNIACSVDLRVNRIIMTLVGETQETGKSSFIEFLCPPALKDYYTESALDNSKDSDIALCENFIQNLEELAALNAIEINRLKATISKISVKQRGAYKEFAEVNPRRVNFWASTNKVDFLADDQNTRWLCFNVKSIDFDYNNKITGIQKVDINKVWSQAYQLYKEGFSYQLSAEELQHRDRSNKDYESSSFEKELILRYFKPATDPYGQFMTNSQIMIELSESLNNKHKINIFAISRAMKQLGFVSQKKKIQGRSVRGYKLEIISVMDTIKIEEVDTPVIKPL